MNNAKLIKFEMNFSHLHTKNQIKEFQKVLIESEWLGRLFYCTWGKTTINGTKAVFTACTEEEAIKRFKELHTRVEILRKEYRND